MAQRKSGDFRYDTIEPQPTSSGPMNFRTTYILFGFVALILAGLGIALLMEPSRKETEKAVFPSVRDAKTNEEKIKLDDIDGVEIDRSGSTKEKLVFVREPGSKRWTV